MTQLFTISFVERLNNDDGLAADFSRTDCFKQIADHIVLPAGNHFVGFATNQNEFCPGGFSAAAASVRINGSFLFNQDRFIFASDLGDDELNHSLPFRNFPPLADFCSRRQEPFDLFVFFGPILRGNGYGENQQRGAGFELIHCDLPVIA